MKSLHKNKGITLIELMIVVAIVGILAAVATPSYLDYVRRGEYSAAQQGLMSLAQAMEQYYAQNLTYRGAGDGNTATDDTNSTPAVYTDQAPADGEAKYNLTLTVANGGNSYTLFAKTVKSGSTHQFSYTSTGVKAWITYDGTTISGCWNTTC